MSQVVATQYATPMTKKPVLLPVGTQIVSVHGETNAIDGEEVSTGPMALGFIETVLPKQETCYSVVFPESGVAIYLTPEELTDVADYRIKSLPASEETNPDDVPVTKALLSVVLAVEKGAGFFRAESSLKEDFGLEVGDDWTSRCEGLFFKSYGEQAKACGLSLNAITLEAITSKEVPAGVLSTRFEDLPAVWVFNPYRGWRQR